MRRGGWAGGWIPTERSAVGGETLAGFIGGSQWEVLGGGALQKKVSKRKDLRSASKHIRHPLVFGDNTEDDRENAGLQSQWAVATPLAPVCVMPWAWGGGVRSGRGGSRGPVGSRG